MPSDFDRTATLFLFEDDEALAGEIVAAFAAEGHAMARIADEAEIRDLVRAGRPAVLIMDRMIGDGDSLAIVDNLRREGARVPVLVISSLSSVDDRIFGLKSGGDDYLVKPFAMGELIARVEALRRRGGATPATHLSVGPLDLDLIARTARRGTREIVLLPREFSLLEYLMRHADQVVTRAMLLEDVWNYRMSTQTNVVDVHVGNLRRKIEIEGENRLLVSVRSLGFKLTTDQKAHD